MIAECKCSTTVDALLDVDTNKVMCQNCGEVIDNISEFMKNTMKSNGHIIRNGNNVKIPKGGMLVECNATVDGKFCGNKFAALLEKKDEECYCPRCHSKVALAGFAKALLRENGQYIGMVDFDEENPNNEEEEHNGPVVFNDKVENDNKKLVKITTAGTVANPATVKQLEALRVKIEAQESKPVTAKKRGRPAKVK